MRLFDDNEGNLENLAILFLEEWNYRDGSPKEIDWLGWLSSQKR